MGYISGTNRNQISLFPNSIDEYIAEENTVRILDAFVDGLSNKEIGFKRIQPAATGRPAYDPKDLLKLYIYGYMNRIRSSRKLMTECKRNVEVFWLLKQLTPDFRTIADFRKDNAEAIRTVFKAFVSICCELNMLGNETFAVDGTKIRANNSIKRSFTPEILEKKIYYLRQQEAQLEHYLAEMDEQDKKEFSILLDVPKEQMPEKLEEIRRRAKKYEGYQNRLAKGEETQILETDPECRTMHTKDGLHPSYNIQTSVEEKSHIIADFLTTAANSDQNQLRPMAERLKEQFELETVHVIADKGYEKREEIENCIMTGILPDVGLKYDKEARIHVIEHIPSEITPQQKASAEPADIQACLHAGVLPDCYEGSNIHVEVHHLNDLSCFIRHEDGHVTCPMGKELFQNKQTKNGTVYASREACRTCTHRCTDSKGHKTVKFAPETKYVPVLMYGNPQYEVQKLPDEENFPLYNAFHRKSKQPSRVMITIKRDKAMQQRRKELIEHPFGTVKWYDGAHYFLCRGIRKVTAEMSLSFLSYNIKRAIKIVGFAPLLKHLQQKAALKVIET